MNNRFLRLIQLSVFTLDMLSLNILVILLQFGHHIKGVYSLEYAYFWIWLNASWLIVARIYNLYQEKYISSFELFSRRTTHVFLYWIMLVVVYLFFTRQYELSRLFILSVLFSQG